MYFSVRHDICIGLKTETIFLQTENIIFPITNTHKTLTCPTNIIYDINLTGKR